MTILKQFFQSSLKSYPMWATLYILCEEHFHFNKMKPKMEGGRGLGVGEVLKLSVLEIEVRKSHINV